MQLEEVLEPGPGRRQKIKTCMGRAEGVSATLCIFLHSYGVSTSRAVRVHNAYGE